MVLDGVSDCDHSRVDLVSFVFTHTHTQLVIGVVVGGRLMNSRFSREMSKLLKRFEFYIMSVIN